MCFLKLLVGLGWVITQNWMKLMEWLWSPSHAGLEEGAASSCTDAMGRTTRTTTRAKRLHLLNIRESQPVYQTKTVGKTWETLCISLWEPITDYNRIYFCTLHKYNCSAEEKWPSKCQRLLQNPLGFLPGQTGREAPNSDCSRDILDVGNFLSGQRMHQSNGFSWEWDGFVLFNQLDVLLCGSLIYQVAMLTIDISAVCTYRWICWDPTGNRLREKILNIR